MYCRKFGKSCSVFYERQPKEKLVHFFKRAPLVPFDWVSFPDWTCWQLSSMTGSPGSAFACFRRWQRRSWVGRPFQPCPPRSALLKPGKALLSKTDDFLEMLQRGGGFYIEAIFDHDLCSQKSENIGWAKHLINIVYIVLYWRSKAPDSF